GPAVAARRGAQVEVPLRLTIRPGYHINSNAPAEEYLIPTTLHWTPSPGWTVRGVTYPKTEKVNYEFSEQPLLVYSGAISIQSRLAVGAQLSPGPITLAGKLRYQACNDKMCLPPRTLEVSVPLRIE
ncbi:MAG: protein-disulfide reductase DsbD domain-containing protein, partial [Gemmatimonadales bacterium]